ncbi:MAG: 3'(2'),5'-bisphosphate nucleotidase CysQ [Deltaproteobacteria bacterium]|nr:3'(2'),5'-bisphosphate nucleotidase CysQ [Deltaproteobacteria bacterium]
MRELEVATAAAREAGAVIRSLYGTGLAVVQKGDRGDSPLTEADTRANQLLHERIASAFPADAWLSEESRDTADRLRRPRVWIVDPLDGTKEFVRGIPELAVCVALVENGAPLVGVTYNPIRDELFAAARGAGATLDGRPVHVTPTADLARARVLASRSENERGEWERFRGRFAIDLCGSVAYKLALVAAGRADATFTLSAKNEWDICSSACLIECAGGRVSDLSGAPVRYNRPGPRLGGVVASNGVLHDAILAAIRP